MSTRSRSSARRTLEVLRVTLQQCARRPLFWVLIVLLALTAWGLSFGGVRVSTGDSDTGGTKAWMTSQFGVARYLVPLVFLFHSFFIAVVAGMLVIQDEDDKVGELLHSTALTTREYVWGKWLAVSLSFAGVLALHTGFHAFFNHVTTGAEQAEFVGPFELASYAIPALVLCVPIVVFVAGVSFALGTWTRKPIAVFFLPVVLVLVCTFLWSWNPSWLQADHPGVDRLLGYIDPGGVRWLQHTWLDVDRGVEFYNHQPIGFDTGFVVSRGAMVLLGLLAVFVAERRFASTLRGAHGVSRTSKALAAQRDELVERPRAVPLGALSMSSRAPGLLTGVLEVARVELRELRGQPGLYLWVPLILLEVIGNAMFRIGPFDTPVLVTSGTLAADAFHTLTLLVCSLLVFYTVESLERERARGLAPIYYATPVRSASILFGKSIANSLVGVVVLVGAFLGSVIVLLVQGKAPIELAPFAIVWGLLLVPTFFAWSAFVTVLYALARNRYSAYALAFATFAAVGYLQFRGDLTWASNWNLWGTVLWSDIGPFELDRAAFVANRLGFVALGIALTALAVKLFPRRDLDAATVVQRLAPGALLRSTLRFAPYLAAPALLLGYAAYLVASGRGGDEIEKRAKDYWRKNVATWTDAPQPSVTAVELDLELKPRDSWFRARGSYVLVNDRDKALRQFAVTPGLHFEELVWTLDGKTCEPEDRSGLRVFTPPAPLAPGARIELGFSHHGRFPDGVSKNGGGASEFILPSGAVLTSFGPAVVPMIGYLENVGIDEDNRFDSEQFADDFYEGVTRSGFGNNTPMTTHITIHVPEEYTANSVGELVSDTVADGVRTAEWRSDYPVEFFNVICGKWDVRRGEGTAIHFHREHAWNIDEMLLALDGARKHYAAWFHPYPWKELKLSEFAAHAGYAQGFPTNITFSEGIGFLAKSDPRSRVAFIVAAHESAHQWWGNLLVPGDGPGGNILSEGTAHFSTILLCDELLGLRDRVEFCKRIESSYGEQRQVDSEKPLVWIDGTRDGDTTATYDKGGWVFWMLLHHMGRERALAGMASFIAKYHHNADHPVLQDFVAHLREHASDVAAYDAFAKQWFFEVVVPEYELADAHSEKRDGVDEWLVKVRVTNKGTGTMPVEVCAARGERFGDEDDVDEPAPSSPDSVQAAEPAAKPASDYRDARRTIVLAAGESQEVELLCLFEPERVLVDPDCLVLQLRRELATVNL